MGLISPAYSHPRGINFWTSWPPGVPSKVFNLVALSPVRVVNQTTADKSVINSGTVITGYKTIGIYILHIKELKHIYSYAIYNFLQAVVYAI
jgi:hypothetical protein